MGKEVSYADFMDQDWQDSHVFYQVTIYMTAMTAMHVYYLVTGSLTARAAVTDSASAGSAVDKGWAVPGEGEAAGLRLSLFRHVELGQSGCGGRRRPRVGNTYVYIDR